MKISKHPFFHLQYRNTRGGTIAYVYTLMTTDSNLRLQQ